MAQSSRWPPPNDVRQPSAGQEKDDLLVDFRSSYTTTNSTTTATDSISSNSINKSENSTSKRTLVGLSNGHQVGQQVNSLVNGKNGKLFTADFRTNHISRAQSFNTFQDEKQANDDEDEKDEEEEFGLNEKQPLILNTGNNFELKQRSSQHRQTPKLLNNGNKNLNCSLQQTQRTNHILYEIRPGDTLLSISLACQCTLEELKRMNGLMREQEFYGLRHLKIPAWKLGVFSQALQNNGGSKLIDDHSPAENMLATNSPLIVGNKLIVSHLPHSISSPNLPVNQSADINNETDRSTDLPMINELGVAIVSNCTQPGNPIPGQAASLVIDVSSKQSISSSPAVVGIDQPTDPQSFLSSLDQSVEQIRKQTAVLQQQSGFACSNAFASDFNAHLSNAFTSQAIQTGSQTAQSTSNSAFNCDGADCGLSWTWVVCIALFVCVLGPLLYTFIWAEERIAENQIYHHLTED